MNPVPIASPPPATLRLRDVALSVGGRRLFSPVSLHVEPGEIVTLVGPSGSGKSSLLAFLCGTLPPAFEASGEIHVGDENLSPLVPERRRLGILFQDDLLFPHLSVGQNLAFALAPRFRGRAERRNRIEAALVEAGLEGFVDRDPATLSGGQRARVGVMRVLLSEPRALLLDEPFSKLDPATRERFREFVFEHLRRRKLPTLLVTHDVDDARAAGGRMLSLPGA